MALTLTWGVVNLVLPVALPPVSMGLAGKFMARTDVDRKNARILRTVQEGQMGWLAIAWSALGLYESWTVLEANPELYTFVVSTTVAFLCVIFGSVFILVGETMNASEKEEEMEIHLREHHRDRSRSLSVRERPRKGLKRIRVSAQQLPDCIARPACAHPASVRRDNAS
ncbi:hypothetical protein [Paraburkholderia caledonica]|uniref:MFS transporter n=1 Tax=Paraburkholderia caledonica TaxID=134536 RepID=A0AB73ILV9_9BURK|nr:hypothetical protein [Paraburkholderia caledonica]